MSFAIKERDQPLIVLTYGWNKAQGVHRGRKERTYSLTAGKLSKYRQTWKEKEFNLTIHNSISPRLFEAVVLNLPNVVTLKAAPPFCCYFINCNAATEWCPSSYNHWKCVFSEGSNPQAESRWYKRKHSCCEWQFSILSDTFLFFDSGCLSYGLTY